ncbi:MAG TPA: F0F1 ATP synthase subunit B [Candidatus Paceibacterota bacterium]|nr:F0F1 ATP synthase subunit B [Candidatus Paceibacterota bacterium]
MNQLFAAFGIDWRLLIIQGVNFAVLLSALSYFLYRPVIKMIDDRRAKIAEGMRMAEAAQQRLLDAKVEGEGLVGSAAREAEGLVASARMRADEKSDEIMNAAQMRADALMKNAVARAEESKRRALQESEREVARAAMLAAEKILLARPSLGGGGATRS